MATVDSVTQIQTWRNFKAHTHKTATNLWKYQQNDTSLKKSEIQKWVEIKGDLENKREQKQVAEEAKEWGVGKLVEGGFI